MNIKKLGFISAMALGSMAFVTSCNPDNGKDIILSSDSAYALTYGTNTCEFIIKDSDVNWSDSVSASDIILKNTKLEGKNLSVTKTSNKVLSATFTGDITNPISEPSMDFDLTINTSAFTGKKVKSAKCTVSLFKSGIYVNALLSESSSNTSIKAPCWVYGINDVKYAGGTKKNISELSHVGFSGGAVTFQSTLDDDYNLNINLHELTYDSTPEEASITLKKGDLKNIFLGSSGLPGDVTIKFKVVHTGGSESIEFADYMFYYTKA